MLCELEVPQQTLAYLALDVFPRGQLANDATTQETSIPASVGCIVKCEMRVVKGR